MTERFCPNCGEVFESAVETCTDCGSPLADGPPPVQLPPGYVEYTLLGNTATLAEAYVVRAALADDDIPVRIEQEFALTQAMGGLAMPAGGYAMSIPIDLADDALQALKTMHENPLRDEGPESTEEVSKQTRSLRLKSSLVLLFFMPYLAPVVFVLLLEFWPNLLAGRIRGLQKAELIFITLFALAITLLMIATLVYNAYASALLRPYGF